MNKAGIGCELPRWYLLKQELCNLDPGGFWELWQQTEGAVLLDVRTRVEYEAFALPEAQILDYLDDCFLDQLDQLDRDCTYFIYCRSGRRSVRTAVLMKNWGFKHLVHLDGGIVAWLHSASSSAHGR